MTTIPNCPWPQAPAHPVLSNNEVHVWCASLEQNAADCALLLSADEQARARRFRFEREQRRFTIGRGLLRLILSRYLNIPPENLQFEYGTYGKPALDVGTQNISFNLAHSGELALYAITANLEIGVDLEQIHPIPDVQQLAEQYFSPSEKAELNALPPGERLEAFFRGWTLKEAWLKARGDGLTYPLNQFSVSMAPDGPVRLSGAGDDSQELARWSLRALNPADGYIGALAVAGQIWRLVQWQVR